MKQKAIDLYNHLNIEWGKKTQNLKKCVDILGKLKVTQN